MTMNGWTGDLFLRVFFLSLSYIARRRTALVAAPLCVEVCRAVCELEAHSSRCLSDRQPFLSVSSSSQILRSSLNINLST